MIWHGILSGGLLVAFLTAEISYDIHLFSGAVALAAVIVRVMIGLIVSPGSPLALGFAPPVGMPLLNQSKKVINGLMTMVLLIIIGASALSGWLIFDFGGEDDLHEGLAAFAGMAIFAHITLAAIFHSFKGKRPRAAAGKPTPLTRLTFRQR